MRWAGADGHRVSCPGELFCALPILLSLLGAVPAQGADEVMPAALPATPYQLTARPWAPLQIPRGAYLDRVEGMVRFMARHQNTRGAIIDPLVGREFQYATPYFANALATLLASGRARDLLAAGIAATDHATENFGAGAVPDKHTEFFIPALTETIELLTPVVSPAKAKLWRQRMSRPASSDKANNWVAYFMKGQWMRARAGLIPHDRAVSDIEQHWLRNGQRDRIANDPLNLYQDRRTDPDSLAVEVVGRANLLALVADGYDGPSASEIRSSVAGGTRTSLLLMDPSGQMPTNGRTDNHVWADVGYQLAFEAMAEQALAAGDHRLAGQYRHAAMMTFVNIDRWRRTDGPWAGSYYVTKNRFDPAERVGYQTASQYSNYGGSLMYHLGEAYHQRKSEITEQPAPVEIGGYAFATGPAFGAAFANAGGMMIQVDLRGDTELVLSPDYWCALGIVRFGRIGWDTRLGPSDGVRTGSGAGVSFAPTFRESGQWVRLASVPERYAATFTATRIHPLLVRVRIDYAPRDGQPGSRFQNDLIITPDGILSTMTRSGKAEGPWGVTLPLLENDGTPLITSAIAGHRIARTAYRADGDEQIFIAVGRGVDLTAEPALLSSYGRLRPVRATMSGAQNRTFIYPRSPDDPSAETVRDSFRVTATGFRSALGRVDGETYVGRTAAGGMARKLDLDGDGRPEITFGEICGFVVQLREGQMTMLEADRNVTATIRGRRIDLNAHAPVQVDESR